MYLETVMASVESQTVRLNYSDSDERLGSVDFPVGSAPATISADFLTAVEALVATSDDDGTGSEFTMAALQSVDVVVRIVPTAVPIAAMGDIRDKWQITFPADQNRRSVPGRSTAGILTTTESKGEFADKTEAAVTAWFDAMVGVPPAGIGVVDPDDGSSPTLSNLGIRATTSRRERPRI